MTNAWTARRTRDSPLLADRSRLRLEMRHGFDLGSLRKHVERGNRLDSELFLQFFQVTSQCGGIAGNINQRRWRKIENCVAHVYRKAGGGRIDNKCGVWCSGACPHAQSPNVCG